MPRVSLLHLLFLSVLHHFPQCSSGISGSIVLFHDCFCLAFYTVHSHGMLARGLGVAIASTCAVSPGIASTSLKSGEFGSFGLRWERKGGISTWDDNFFLISRRLIMIGIIASIACRHCHFLFPSNNHCLCSCPSFLVYSQSDFSADFGEWRF